MTHVPESSLDPRHAVYVGSFDPVSLGHENIITRGARIFQKLTVGIGINPDKKPLFTPDERLDLLQQALANLDNVEVKCFSGLTVDFIREQNAAVMLRGLRTLSDIESEFTMTLANQALEPAIETVFLMAAEKYTHVSSTLIKQVARMGRNTEEQLRQFVPEPVIAPLIAKSKSH